MKYTITLDDEEEITKCLTCRFMETYSQFWECEITGNILEDIFIKDVSCPLKETNEELKQPIRN